MLFIETNAEVVSLIEDIGNSLLINLDKKDFGLQGTAIFFLLENKSVAFGMDVDRRAVLISPLDEATVASAIEAKLSSVYDRIESILQYAEQKVMGLIPFMQMEVAS